MAPPEMCVVDNPRRIGGKSEMMDGVLCCDVLCCAVVCEYEGGVRVVVEGCVLDE